ncbi:MAG: hypothetical protein ACOCW1_03280 [Chitinispirillaceae bacterium]
MELPPEVDRLSDLILGGDIDSAQYEGLLDLYALPLSVPQGELGQLLHHFPTLAGEFPDRDELGSYSPWGSRDVQRLFDDYPVLEAFRPVLRFNIRSGYERGEVVVTLNRSRWDKISGQRFKFRHSLSPLGYEGTVQIDESVARWQERRIRVDLSFVEGTVGSFSSPFPGKLFFGKFGESENADASVVSNWLYASRRGWNGAWAEIFHPEVPKKIRGMLFYHTRPSEIGWGAGAQLLSNKRLKVFGGFSKFDLFDTTVSVEMVHFYSEVAYEGLKAVFETGSPVVKEFRALPLSFRVRYRQKLSSVEYGLLYFPQKLNLPMSSLRGQILRTSEISDDLGAAVRHSFRFTVPFGRAVKFVPDVELSGDDVVVRRIVASAGLHGGWTVLDWRLRQAFDSHCTEPDSVLHSTTVSFFYKPAFPINLKLNGNLYYGLSRKRRDLFVVDLCYNGLPNLEIGAYLRGVSYPDRFDLTLGLEKNLMFFKKTWTTITLEKPLLEQGWDNVQFRGASGFLF